MKLSHILYEKIRSKSFNIQEFKQLKTPEEMVDYAEQCGLTFINAGSSRRAYVLSSRFVLKIANPKLQGAGRAQNEAEARATETASETVKFVIPQVRQHNPQYNWIISDLVRPANNMEEVAKHAGIHESQLWSLLEDGIPLEHLESSLQQNPFVKGLEAVILSGVSAEDLTSKSQFGITADGRAVVLDYGGTNTVLNDFYAFY
jgi:DNA-binding phage protein